MKWTLGKKKKKHFFFFFNFVDIFIFLLSIGYGFSWAWWTSLWQHCKLSLSLKLSHCVCVEFCYSICLFVMFGGKNGTFTFWSKFVLDFRTSLDLGVSRATVSTDSCTLSLFSSLFIFSPKNLEILKNQSFLKKWKFTVGKDYFT